MKLTITLIGICVIIFISGGHGLRDQSASQLWKRLTGAIVDRTQRTFSCKENFEVCRGVPWARCCGELICYRDSEVEVHDPFDEGICVECIDGGQICQRDEQCCTPLTCIRDNFYNINGLCQPKLGSSEECIEDDDCRSDNCMKKHFWNTKGTCQ